LGGGRTAPEKAVSTSRAADGSASAPEPGPLSRTRNRRAPRGETIVSCSAPPTLIVAWPVSPWRAAVRAANRLEPEEPDLGRRWATPIVDFQAALAACTLPSGAATAAGSLSASTICSAPSWVSVGASVEPRSTKSPRQATPARPISSRRPAAVVRPAFIAGAAAKTTAIRKKTTAAAVSGSNRPLRALRTLGSAMAGDGASCLARPALNGREPRTISPDESVTGILSHGSSRYRAPLLSVRAATERPALRMKPMILATAS
jgi:hypothetical protein